MSNQIRVGHWKADGNDVHIPVGFVPDYVKVWEVGESNPNSYEWFERQEDDEPSGSQEGNIIAGSDGQVTQSSDDAGIKAYDAGSQSPTVLEWTESRGTAATARTATAPGTFIKATVGGLNNLGAVTDRDAIFECVTAGTSDSSEPVWPTAIGGQITNNSVTWERVNEPLLRIGYMGFTVADDIQTGDREYYYLALKAGDSIDHGDVDSWASGVDQNWS